MKDQIQKSGEALKNQIASKKTLIKNPSTEIFDTDDDPLNQVPPDFIKAQIHGVRISKSISI